MSFNSLYFLLFLFITVLLYYIFPRKMKPFFLLAANYGFYALYNVKVLPFLIIFSVLIYIFGLLLEKHPKAVLLTLIIFLALVPLLICKYANWLISLLAKLFPTFLINETTPIFSIVLPLGISYFTFKSIGYLADVYKGTLKAETNFILLAVFISFFPEMLIGPIDRASNLLVQLKEKSLHADWNQLQLGILLLFGGYFEKMVVADRFGIIVDSVYGNLDIYTGFPVLIAICCYSLQIYFDFAGCTYMALGVGRILGFTLPENFKQPYLATSVEGFWRRWHISLTSWLRDYIYIPLVGNRKGAFRKYLNVMIVFFTSGLWHGAGINFIIWGGLNGIFQIIGTFTTKLRNYIYHFLHINENSFLSVWWKRGWTFIWMSIAWVFFRAGSFSEALHIFKNLFSSWNPHTLYDGTIYTFGLSKLNILLLLFLFFLMLTVELLHEKQISLCTWFMNRCFFLKCVITYFLIFAVLILGIYGTAYDAGNFIYMQF